MMYPYTKYQLIKKAALKKNSNGTHEKIIQSTRSLLNVNSIYMLISQKLRQSYVNLSTFFQQSKHKWS